MPEEKANKETSLIEKLRQNKLRLLSLIFLASIAMYFLFSTSSEEVQEKNSVDDLISTNNNVKVAVDNSPMQSLPLKPPEMPELEEPFFTPPVPKSQSVPEPSLLDLPLPPVLKEFPSSREQPPEPVITYGSKPASPKVGPPASFNKQGRDAPVLIISGDSGQMPENDSATDKGIDIMDIEGNFSRIKKVLENKPNIDEKSRLSRTSFAQVQSTYIGMMNLVVAQGKIIDAVLESAVNTDLSGMLRGIVSRDVYAESGKNVLIPKGSRLVGTYKTDVRYGQSRVDIIWERLMLPNGTDIAISSPGTDPLGRTGVSGNVDNKFSNMVNAAFLISSIKIGAGYVVDKLLGSNGSDKKIKIEIEGEKEIKTGDTLALMADDATKDITTSLTDIVEQSKDVKPSIKIPQGAKIKVFVNRDLVFPKSSLSGIN